MLDDLSKTLMNVVYAGVGAVSLVAEQAGKAGKVLVERGEAAVEQMGKYSEELQRKCQEDAQRRRDERMDGRLSAMSAQEREALRRRLCDWLYVFDEPEPAGNRVIIARGATPVHDVSQMDIQKYARSWRLANAEQLSFL